MHSSDTRSLSLSRLKRKRRIRQTHNQRRSVNDFCEPIPGLKCHPIGKSKTSSSPSCTQFAYTYYPLRKYNKTIDRKGFKSLIL